MKNREQNTLKRTAILLLLLTGLLPNITRAQTIDFDSIFENLDPANIPTGILYDAIYPQSEIMDFDGTTFNSIMNKSQWLLIYKEILAAHLASFTIPTIEETYGHLNETYGQQQVPICISNINFNVIKVNALDDSLLLYIDDQLYDVVNPPESPDDTYRYFSAVTIPLMFNKENITFKFDPSLYISNTNETIQSIDLDFGNGYTYSDLSLNSQVTIAYNNIGSTIELTAHLADGTNLVCIFEGEKEQLKSQPVSSADYTFPLGVVGYNNKGFSVSFSVWYGCETSSYSDLKKPIIILEGWDPLNKRNEEDEYGEVNVKMSNDEYFLTSLREKGFDIVIVNYDHGEGEIQGNAMIVEEVINEINGVLEANNSISNLVVMGVSMGGLIARYALADLESKGGHNTRLF